MYKLQIVNYPQRAHADDLKCLQDSSEYELKFGFHLKTCFYT